MSRVTFSDLYTDYLNVNTSVEDCKKVQPIEIIPRKIVEEIMETCDYYMSDKFTIYERGVAASIKNRARLLLRQFEEDAEDE